MIRRIFLSAVAAYVLVASAAFFATAIAGAWTIDHAKGPFKPPVFAVQPPRVELTAKAGERLSFEFGVQNRLGAAHSVDLTTTDLKGSKNPDMIFEIVESSAFGASKWLTLEKNKVELEDGDRLKQVVEVQVPDDVSPGSYYATIQSSIGGTTAGNASSGGTGVNLVKSLTSEIFIDIAGPKQYRGRIEKASFPTFVQHGLTSLIPFDVIYANTGTATDEVGGSVRIKSIFGNTAAELKIDEGFVLRGGKRSFRATWGSVPWIGVFTPEVRIKGHNGKVLTKKLPRVIVIPPWYYLVALGVALLIPVVWQIRRRREWRKYLDSDNLDDPELYDDFDA